MMYFSRLRTALILGVCLLGVLLSLPNAVTRPIPGLPWRSIHLGLDLRGGSYLLMQVDVGAVTRARLESLADAVRHALLTAGLGYRDIHVDAAAHALVFTPRDVSETTRDLAAIADLPRDRPGEFAGATRPDGAIAVTLSQAGIDRRASQAVEQSIEIVRRRIDATGVVDPSIARVGAERIVVQLPGVSDPAQVRALLGTTAKMTFQLVDENAPPGGAAPGDELLPSQEFPGQNVAVFRHVEVDGGDLTNAQAATDPQTGQWDVNFTFDGAGARRFATVTANNLGKRFAIVLDGKRDLRAGDPGRDPGRPGADLGQLHRGLVHHAGAAAARRRAALRHWPCWNSARSGRSSAPTASAPARSAWPWASCW